MLLSVAPLVVHAKLKPTETHTSLKQLNIGEKVPWFAGWRPNDTVVNRTKFLSTIRGKGAVIAVFATWCVECRVGLHALAKNRARLKKAGIEVLLVAYEEAATRVQAFLKMHDLAWAEVMLDKFGTASTALGAVRLGDDGRIVVSLPVTVVVDPAGVMRGIFTREGPDYVDRILTSLGQGT
ncbi:MAG: TlpA disulfide reductase family protein [Myxococcota bacterium]|nr:TlpA disulfide reductase family protein [Myxococcota bacterium]